MGTGIATAAKSVIDPNLKDDHDFLIITLNNKALIHLAKSYLASSPLLVDHIIDNSLDVESTSFIDLIKRNADFIAFDK